MLRFLCLWYCIPIDLMYSNVLVTLRYPSTTNIVDALSINAHKDITIDTAIYGSYNIRNLELESHEELDLERSPCSSDPNYSFEEVL